MRIVCSPIPCTALLGLALVAGCGASPPPARDLTGPNPVTGQFASLARCTSTAPPACPGVSCADNAAGKAGPDGKTVNLAACGTLDLVFTGGTILSCPDQPLDGVKSCPSADLRFYLGVLAGLTRVEASGDGQRYVIIGFIARKAELPPGTEKGCGPNWPEVDMPDTTTPTLSLGACNSLSEARFLRLSRDSGNPGALTVDAVEALTFKPAGS